MQQAAEAYANKKQKVVSYYFPGFHLVEIIYTF